MTKYMLGIDIGTTNTKAALYSYSGEEIMVALTTYDLHTNETGAATQNPDEITAAVYDVMMEITDKCAEENINISFISFSSVMHSLLAVDEEGAPLTPVITWGDRRSEPYVKNLENEKGSSIYHRTGTPIHPMSPLVKLLWLQHEQPEITKQADRFIGIKSYVLHQLFGEYYTDYSVANATGLFNMHTLKWDEEALNIAGITEEKLAKPLPTTQILPPLKPEVVEELGLQLETQLVIGASDGCLSNLGVNAIKTDTVALSVGTSGAIRTVTNQPQTDKNERTFCYALTEDHWVIGGPVNNGGVILDWALEQYGTVDHKTLMEEIKTAKPGADGLFFHPYLVGERAPIWRADVKGSFYGLSIHHQHAHMLRAILEGINFNLYAVYHAISEVIGDGAEEILATGGFTKSPVWVQMLADIFGIEIAITNVTENGCFGAALLGLLATGEIDDFSDIGKMFKIKRQYTPNQETHVFYQEHFEKYQKITQHLLKLEDDL